MKRLFVYSLVFLSMVSTAKAENCTNIDFSAELGEPRSQGDIGWCYANASADLLSYRYRTELRGEKISAVYTALLYNKTYYSDLKKILTQVVGETGFKLFKENFSDTIGEGGFMSLAIHEAVKKGFCPKDFDDQLARHGNKDLSLQAKLERGLQIKTAFDKHKKNRKNAWLKGALPVIEDIRSKDNILDDISNDRLYQILQTSNADNFLIQLGDEICRGEKHVPKNYYRTHWKLALNRPSTNWYLFRDLDKQISKRNPVGVMYYATLFDGWVKPKPGDAHASVIVGRRWLPPGSVLPSGEVLKVGSCQYKLRNSWGKSCNPESYKNKDLRALTSSSPANAVQGCENGHVWVDREKYKNYLYGIVYIGTEKTLAPSGTIPTAMDLIKSISEIPYSFSR